MGLRAIALLLLVAGGLTAVLLLTDRKPPAKTVAEMAVLDGRSLTEAARFRWQFAERAPVEITRDATGFRLTEPLVDAASPGYLKQICDTWDSAQMRAVPLQDDAAGRQSAGLEPPELTFTAEFPDGLRITIDVGAPGPLGTTRFLRRDGKLWEGGEGLLASLRVGVEDLRDHAVFRTSPQLVTDLRVEQVTPTGKREALRLARQGDSWRLTEPIDVRADDTAALRFATAVLSLRVDLFAPGVARPPERDPEIVVTARGVAGEETVRMWVERGSVYGQLPERGGITFTSDNRQYTQIFENAVTMLRARILVPLGNLYQEITGVVVDPGQGRGERLRLTRESGVTEWRLEEPVAYAGAATPCNELLQAINNLHAIEFVAGEDGALPKPADPRYGLGPGRLQLTVQAGDQGKAIDLWLGGETTRSDLELAYACRADEPSTVVLVPREPVDLLRRAWTDYCDRSLLHLSVPVERFVCTRINGAKRVYRRDGARWVLDGAEGSRDDVGSFVNDVLRDLDGRTVVDVRGEAFAVAEWTASLQRENSDQLAALRIWQRGADRPLVVQVVQAGDAGPIGFELPPIHDKQLREILP